jgi:hypothetical protein
MEHVAKPSCTYTSEAHFISKMMEATNTVLCIFKVVVLDETESENWLVWNHQQHELLTPCKGWSCGQ